jgi:hypothetical protein
MYKLSVLSKEHLQGKKPVIVLLIKRTLQRSRYYFEIPDNKETRSSGSQKKSSNKSSMDFNVLPYNEHGVCIDCVDTYKEISNLIKSEFKKMQKEGHFCICERLVWGGDMKTLKDPFYFEVRKH